MEKLISSFSGLDNTSDSTRIEATTMTAATNVDITDTVSIASRQGYTKTHSLPDCHSFYGTATECYYVDASGVLKTISGMSLGTVGTHPLSWSYMGNCLLCSGGTTLYVIEDGVLSVVFVEGSLIRYTMPAGDILFNFNNVLISTKDGYVYYSNPMEFESYDIRECFFGMPGTVLDIVSVGNTAILFNTDAGVYFSQGSHPEDFNWQKVSDIPAFKGSVVSTDGYNFGPGVPGDVAFFVNDKGMYAVTSDGVCREILNHRYQPPALTKECRSLIDNKRYTAIFRK